MLTIGPYAIESAVVLAPMAGVTDLPFRKICSQMGAGLVISEMVTSDTSLWSSSKSQLRLSNPDSAELTSVQIAGSDPDMLSQAAQQAAAMGARIIDINMGCPAKKVCQKQAGSALLRDERLVAKILAAAVKSVAIPVTLKTRTGWDQAMKNGVSVAKIAEDCGIQAISVHGRTRACRFTGEAEYDTIAQIVDAVSIPVIANGDINCAEKAKWVLDYTQAHAVMVGRAALGNPWIFEQISEVLQGCITISKPSRTTITTTMDAHFKELYKFYGDYKGIRIARKHFAWYVRHHFDDTVAVIHDFNILENSKSQLDAVKKLNERPIFYEEKAA